MGPVELLSPVDESSVLAVTELEELMLPLKAYTLALLHRRLDRAADEEARRRFPDQTRLARLKKFRLAVRDRLSRMANGPVSA